MYYYRTLIAEIAKRSLKKIKDLIKLKMADLLPLLALICIIPGKPYQIAENHYYKTKDETSLKDALQLDQIQNC